MRILVSALAAIMATAALFACSETVAQTASGNSGQDKAPKGNHVKTIDEQLAAYDDIAAIFAAVETKSVRGLRWGIIETGFAEPNEEVKKVKQLEYARAGYGGSLNWKETVEGWLIDEKPDAIEVLDHLGETHKFRRPNPREQQPTATEARANSPNNPTAWRIQVGDFVGYCKQLQETERAYEKMSPIFVTYRNTKGPLILDTHAGRGKSAKSNLHSISSSSPATPGMKRLTCGKLSLTTWSVNIGTTQSVAPEVCQGSNHSEHGNGLL